MLEMRNSAKDAFGFNLLFFAFALGLVLCVVHPYFYGAQRCVVLPKAPADIFGNTIITGLPKGHFLWSMEFVHLADYDLTRRYNYASQY
jgi:hypothetical protein